MQADKGPYKGKLPAPIKEELCTLMPADKNFRGDVILVRVFPSLSNSEISI